jgi:hypothetical protein
MRIHSWLIIPALVGCSLPAPRPPAAEFLVADGSSTYWVTSGPTGVHARVSPLILTRADNRYYEVFVSERTHSYQDAVFTAEPIYRRDLITGDSTLLLEDSKINAWEQGYLAHHPSAQLVDPDDDDDTPVSFSAMGESDIVGVVGPYVLYTHRWTLENPDSERADTTRGILDLHLGKPVSTAALALDWSEISGGGVRDKGLTRWQHAGYEVTARFDSTRDRSEMVLKDARHHQWKLGYVESRVPRIFWLDQPKIDARVRTAIANAFDGALSDEDMSQLVSSRPRILPASPSQRMQ